MTPTYWDMERRGSAESWRRLRQYRSILLGMTADDDLQSLFATALHQAEQQFKAATTIGPESRPLNLFYGLSQAGRAIAVAASLSRATPARLDGHGIVCKDLQNFRKHRVPDLSTLLVRSRDSQDASFPVLSKILESQDLSSAVHLGQLWEMLVEPQLHEPLTPPQTPVLLARADALVGPEGSGTKFLNLDGVPASEDFNDPASFAKFTASYPSLAGSTFNRVTGHSSVGDGRWDTQSIQVSWTASSGGSIGAPDSFETYRRSLVVLPAPPGGDRPMHPLMIWWAVMFGLSMLARYEPTSWTKLIDINTSSSAVPIEFLLNTALESVPDILAETLGQLLSEITGKATE